ncbi:D-2-hydroxyacid dehydrogenase [Vibrio gallicus]|uniref:D-2-hydroxyacid dehydrogenase n=1 Tax=Vibrio gallicus TaxID=190897 RepID=UPI0021C424F3|nr:D-2-hydroxyacid dehydrogenase [Vibrio gallicus]
MYKVVFLDQDTIPEHIQFRPLSFEHQWASFPTTSQEQLTERLDGADIVITNKVVLDASTLRNHPSIKLIAVSATGTNNVDLNYCQQQGVAVCNVQGYATQSVPEHVIGMLFALKRNLFAYHQDIQNGVWQHKGQFCFFTHPIADIAGSILAVVGSGSLGGAVGELAKALGMQVIYAERKGASEARAGYVEFEQALKMADAVTLHCPLNEQTQNLISEHELSLMKPTSVLINSGRGGLVEEASLVDALLSNEIAGAGFDVFTQEPADENNPLIANAHLPNLLLTPHVAWGSDSAIQGLVDILLDNIESFVAGGSHNRVV